MIFALLFDKIPNTSILKIGLFVFAIQKKTQQGQMIVDEYVVQNDAESVSSR